MDERELREVAPGVHVRHVPKWHTSSTVIVADTASHAGGALVVDPAMTADEIDALAEQVWRLGLVVTGGVVTHAHVDHVLWRPSLGDAQRWATPLAYAQVQGRPEQVLSEEATAELGIDRDVLRGVRALETDAPVLPWSGRELRLLVHDAHAPGHLALLVSDARVLVAGDMLSAREVPLLDTAALDPLAGYTVGLELLAVPLESGEVDLVVPGHGPVLDREQAIAVLEADRAYIGALRAGDVPEDPRLVDGWVAGQHEQQVQALGITR
ncbi:MBL fold metallo-hydrolase [Actinotalea sp. K2]|uniref:MBL fold metallo-hydrolase n=1 Tax=Actinotalea sp. K2 TaxID=2939438 RepID=UPI0020172A44|nr:MBL fold metallo-hydrolase [Actinotalea sp. K2]MCL3863227.1 MBL fold metallo-hydrolase [Actinotalea sp. K2]